VEFLGAITAGAQVSGTIQKGILQASLFTKKEGLLQLGMLCALIASSTWLQLANFMAWPVSTTHSIVGAVMGIGVAAFGGQGVEWGFCQTNWGVGPLMATTAFCQSRLPEPIKGDVLSQIPGNGFAPIAVSWMFSPIAAGILAATMFAITKYIALEDNVVSKLIYGRGDEAENSFFRSLLFAPFVYGFVAGVLVVLLAFKGVAASSSANSLSLVANNPNLLAAAAGGTAAVVFALACIYISYWQYRTNWVGEDLKWYEYPFFWALPTRPTREGFDTTHRAPLSSTKVEGADLTAVVAGIIIPGQVGANMDLEAAQAEDAKRKEVPQAILDAQKIEGYVVRKLGDSEMLFSKWCSDIKTGAPVFGLPQGIASSIVNSLLLPLRLAFGFGIFGADGKERAVRTYNASDKDIMTLHETAKKYSDRTELVYIQLQMMTSMIASFSHGANDVANAMGPLSTILGVYRCSNTIKPESGCVSPTYLPLKAKMPFLDPPYNTIANSNKEFYSAEDGWETPTWLLAVGGIMLGIGFTSYGYNLMRTLGNNLTYHSPSRCFCMELGAAIIVLLASRVGLPISTTQCITGATIAVGLLNGLKGVNWLRFAEIFFAWMVTMPLVGIYSGLIFLFLASNPTFRSPVA